MCCQSTQSHSHHAGSGQSCGCHGPHKLQTPGCRCGCGIQGFMSKKKKIQALKGVQAHLEDRLDDIKEYIKELEKK
ncbi:MAG: hypothetical protein D3926_00560 [Desulfobacteraceae bacterium]|mgnify:FL=1|nr:MAG: hypothetical protein D3926_00560 [Desulfobacteraceae bacterium]